MGLQTQDVPFKQTHLEVDVNTRTRFVLMAVVMLGCGAGEEDVALRQTTPVATPAPTPSFTPRTPDDTYSTPEKISAWRQDVQGEISRYAEPVKEHPVLQKLQAYTFDTAWLDRVMDPGNMWSMEAEAWKYIRYTHDEEIIDPEAARAEAIALEQDDYEMDAGIIYASLGYKDDVRRCARALVDENEWKAVAILGGLIDDRDLVLQGVGEMIKGDEITRVRDLLNSYAEDESFELIELVQKQHREIDLTLVPNFHQSRMRAWAGKPNKLEYVIREEIRRYDEALKLGVQDDKINPITDIVLLQRQDPVSAQRLAVEVLRKPWFSPVVREVDAGEGGIDLCPVPGALEFLKIYGTNTINRQAYFTRLRAYVQQHVDTIGSDDASMWAVADSLWSCYQNNGEGDPLWSLMVQVRRFNDAEFSKVWDDLLNIMEPMDPFRVEVARLILRGSANLENAELSPEERYVLARFAGVPVEPRYEYVGRGISDQMRGCSSYDLHERSTGWMIQCLLLGSITKDDALALWKTFELPEEPLVPKKIYPKEQYPQVLATYERLTSEGYYDEANALLEDLVGSGYAGPLPYIPRNPSTEFVYSRLLVGDVQIAKRTFFKQLREEMLSTKKEDRPTSEGIVLKVYHPFKVAKHHEDAQRECSYRGVECPVYSPAGVDEVADWVFDAIQIARLQAPELYRAILESDFRRRERYERLLFDREVARLTAAGDLEGIDALMSTE